MLADDQRSKEQRMAGLKLDIFPHILPKPFFDCMKAMAERNPALAGSIKRWLNEEFEAESVAHVIATRLELSARSAEYLASYLSKPSDFERISVDMVMKVASRIERMATGKSKSPA